MIAAYMARPGDPRSRDAVGSNPVHSNLLTPPQRPLLLLLSSLWLLWLLSLLSDGSRNSETTKYICPNVTHR